MAHALRVNMLFAMNSNDSSPHSLPPPTREQISALAHALWQDRGCPPGSDLDIWLEAERQLLGQATPRTVADDIPADLSSFDRDPAIEGPDSEAELDRIVAPRQSRSPTSL